MGGDVPALNSTSVPISNSLSSDGGSYGTRIPVPVFNPSNYFVWSFEMECYMNAENCFGAIDESSNSWPLLSTAAHNVMKHRAFNLIRYSLGASFVYVCGEHDPGQAKELWDHVKKMFVTDDMATKLNLERRFQLIHWDQTRHHVDSFLQELYLIRMEYKTAGFALDDKTVFTKMLLCLPSQFDIERSQMSSWDTPDLAKARKILKERESLLIAWREFASSTPLSSGGVFVAHPVPLSSSSSTSYFGSPSSSSSSSSSSQATIRSQNPVQCRYCHKVGHSTHNCFKLRRKKKFDKHIQRKNNPAQSSNVQYSNHSSSYNPSNNSSQKTKSGQVSLVAAVDDSFTFVMEDNVVDDGFICMMRGDTIVDSSCAMELDSTSSYNPTSVSSWILDSGASHHICNTRDVLCNIQDTDVRLGTGKQGAVLHMNVSGSVTLIPHCEEVPRITLTNVLYTEQASSCIISLHPFLSARCCISIVENKMTISRHGRTILVGTQGEKGLFYMSSHSIVKRPEGACLSLLDMPKTDALRILHARLGHIGAESICRMIKENMVNGLPANLDFNLVPLNCVHCIAGKSTRQPFNRKPTITHEDDVCNSVLFRNIRGPYFVKCTIICKCCLHFMICI